MFVGAKGRMEMEKVPQNGFPIKGLWISGIQRKLTLKNLSFPFKLLSSLFNAYKILKKQKPQVVIGTGGFASGPTLFVASILGIPTLIQEQNSYPGITNKLLSKKVTKICVAYPKLDSFFSKDKIILTGNPVRQDLLEIESKRVQAIHFFNLDKTKKTLLVIGGSLGAKKINELLANQIDWLVAQNIQIIWQIGKLHKKNYAKYNNKENVQTHTFLNKMDYAYAAADIIISRAGAGSIAELCLVAKPTIFIPSPNVAEDHQTKNAQAIVNQHAALLLPESELERFQTLFSGLLINDERQKQMAKKMKELALPNATVEIVNQIEKILK